MEQPNPQANQQGQGAAPAGQPQGQPPAGATPQSKWAELQAKKGFKTPDDLAASYENLEPELGRSKNVIDKAKKQLESAGYTMDADGVIRPLGQPATAMPDGGQGASIPGAAPYQQTGYGQPPEPIYDPYTGQPISDPVAMQLARMPLGQREAFVFEHLANQREQMQGQAYQADAEILTKPEAKGFEDDVRKVMMQKPLHIRAKKESWQEALLQVKGARYDQDMKNAAALGVDGYINKAVNQPMQGTGGTDASGVNLSSDEEAQYRWYQQYRPGTFKDRKQFKEALVPSGSR